MKITKTVKIGGLCRTRKIIRLCRTDEDGHNFLNKQPNNDWQVYDGDLKAGKYAYCGGQWHNVKSLDSSVLAHV